MTALSGDARERLAAALVSFGIDYAQEATDALAPVVAELADLRAAEELRAAADAARGMHDPVAPDCAEWADWLDARAAALTSERTTL